MVEETLSMRIKYSVQGYTLIEIFIVIAIISVLAVVAGPEILKALRSENQVKNAAMNLMTDLKFGENEAIRIGGGDVADPAGTGAFTMTKNSVFAVFSTATNTYRIAGYEDTNGNNQRDSNDTITSVIGSKPLDNNVVFGTLSSVNKTACWNATNSAPAAFISFPADANPPCDGGLCLEFDSGGFPKFTGSTTSGVIYLTNKKDAFAVSINAAGLLTLCKWDGQQWQITH